MSLLWSIDEAARQLGGISTRTVRRLIARGELPTVRIGRRALIPADAVGAWVNHTQTIQTQAQETESPAFAS